MTLEELNSLILEWWETKDWDRGDVSSDKFFRCLDAKHRLRDYACKLQIEKQEGERRNGQR